MLHSHGRTSWLTTSHKRTAAVIALAILVLMGSTCPAENKSNRPEVQNKPLLRVIDLSIGETQSVRMSDGTQSIVKLVSIDEHRDSLRGAVRRAEVTVEVDGRTHQLVSATYNLPTVTGKVQIDCSITRGYNANGTASSWGLQKDARLRLWPAGSPWIRPNSFAYPVRQRWFATHTQMANVPTYVDGGESPERKNIYYHSGLDIGGTEGHAEVIASTDGLVVSAGLDVLPEHRDNTPVRPRYDVVYILDSRGWYYRYSHLKEIDERIRVGRIVSMRDRIGLLGKEGGSGGWSHLHFEIKARQPSGEWGTQAGYAFLWQAYLEQYQPSTIAVARPHHFIRTGESVTLNASKSWNSSGNPLAYRWSLHDGKTSNEPQLTRKYDVAGMYSEVVKVTDESGNAAYDFAIVQVVDDDERTDRLPPTIHPTYAPTFDIRPNDPVRFTVRSFRTTAGRELWNFGDGSPNVSVKSDGNRVKLSPDGYAVATHRFRESGDYIVRVERTNQFGLKATGHIHVRVESAERKVRVVRNIRFLGKDRQEKMDLYLPDEDYVIARPAVVIIHGGGWHGGDKAAEREKNIGGTLAAAGFVCASINYVLADKNDRLDTRLEQVWPQNLHDCKTAVRFLRRHAAEYRIAPAKIGAIGGSAGGHLVAMLATTNPSDGLDPAGPYADTSCRIQAVVPMYGVHDVLQHARSRGTFGLMNAARQELCRNASPVNYVSSDDPPALILHGTKDALVSVQQSKILFEHLRQSGVETELQVIKDAPHSFHLQPAQQDLRATVIDFFDKHLRER
ncbi:MAG: alpha/beta hydrolase fold domain-containing protein [Fuerstiella sp.]|nr:alpha/beta hydrolase fold domain-containing protein [Fuerstiella sp.]MCP4511619.1 alpha/beta hydrolase fold domain-containing protein [Fuerstiella sp.]